MIKKINYLHQEQSCNAMKAKVKHVSTMQELGNGQVKLSISYKKKTSGNHN